MLECSHFNMLRKKDGKKNERVAQGLASSINKN